MKRTYRGAFWIPLIIGIAVAVVIIGVLIYAFGGKGIGGGKGDGEGSESVSAESSISEDLQPETESVNYINVTVSGSDYLYDNQKMTVDELISELNSIGEKFPVKITDDGASLKAYDNLVSALKENDIRYIEQEND